MEELCRLAAAPGERTYLALAHQGMAEAALGAGDRARAEREVGEALGVLDGFEAPVAEWRVWATAARVEEARGRRSRAKAYWRRGAAVLDRLAAGLKDEDDSINLPGQPAVEAVHRNAKRTTAHCCRQRARAARSAGAPACHGAAAPS